MITMTLAYKGNYAIELQDPRYPPERGKKKGSQMICLNQEEDNQWDSFIPGTGYFDIDI